MKIIRLLILLVVTCSSCTDSSHSNDLIEIEGIPPGAIQEEFADTPGLIKVSVNDNSGKIIAQGLYLNQKREGSWVEYSTTGKIKSVITYVAGKMEGTKIEFNESGQLQSQSYYHNGLQEGEYQKV
ncbi:MAG: hypothetical protein U5K54_11305 [Cytophagales bacterium]|nr:hypothetical protein [Cytophagales bacterium]